jgi:uncharacterized delta-60 repeat protein
MMTMLLPTPSRPMKSIPLLLFLTLALRLTAASNTTLYQTSFEAPAFTPGSPLRGQDNWEMYHDGEAISVVTNNARTGAQCLRMEGALLEQVGPNFATAYGFSRALDAFSNNPPAIVEITASVRLDGPQTGTNGTPDLDILSANLMAVVPRADGQGQSLGGFFVSSAGRIWTYSPEPADNYKFSVPYTFGTYRTLRLRVDFVARTLGYFVDDVRLGSVNFPSSITADRLISGYIYLNGQLEPVTTPELTYHLEDYTAYFDDYSLVSVPLSPVNAVIEFGALSYPYTNFLADEFDAVAKVRVIRRGFTNAAVRATLVTSNQTARTGEHYLATSTLVNFAPGETNKIVEIPLAPDDFWPEPDVTFTARLINLLPGASSSKPVASITIRDDERPGSIDPTWTSALGLPPLGSNEVRYVDPHIVFIQPDGKAIIDAWVFPEDFGYALYWNLVRINPDGSVDPTYPIRDSFPSHPKGFLLDRKVAALPDGSLIVWDSEDSGSGFLGYRLRYKLKPDGTIDETFPKITSQGAGSSFEFIPQSDGKVLVNEPSAAVFLNGKRMPWLFRLNVDGTLDTDFTAPAHIAGSVRLLDSHLFVERESRPAPGIYRLQNDGSLDVSFSAPTNLNLHILHRLSDGRLLVTERPSRSSLPLNLYRLNQDGSLDSTFATGTVTSREGPVDIVKAFSEANGKMVLVGLFHTYNGREQGSIVRLNVNGSVDETYESGVGAMGVPRIESWPGQLFGAEMLDDGRLLLPGNFSRFDDQPVSPPIILNSEGRRDPHFGGTLVDLGGISPAYILTQSKPWGGQIHYANGYGLGRLRMDLPLRIVSHTQEPSGSTHLLANALPDRTYTLQASENLSDWLDLTTQVATTNRIEFTDAPALPLPRRLYRVKQN